MRNTEKYAGKRVLVVGMARSGIAAAHIPDQLQLLFGVLIRMMVRSARFLTQ